LLSPERIGKMLGMTRALPAALTRATERERPVMVT
jgi:hypothetical protein